MMAARVLHCEGWRVNHPPYALRRHLRAPFLLCPRLPAFYIVTKKGLRPLEIYDRLTTAHARHC